MYCVLFLDPDLFLANSCNKQLIGKEKSLIEGTKVGQARQTTVLESQKNMYNELRNNGSAELSFL